jgi:NADH dehydrogenase/NADH:ubiquinone oxidoreductase subunit G
LPSEIELKTSKGSAVEFKFQKILMGRYYLTLEKTAEISSAQIDFFVKGKPLKEHFQLSMRLADKTKTTIKMLRNDRNELTFKLRLADKNNLPVETPDQPEILLDGEGSVEEMRHISEGVWEFKVIYPEQNQIMYFSVRAHGVYLGKVFRYQHVEK